VGDESIDPYAYFVGRVQRVFGKGEPVRTDLRPYIDAQHKTVKSITGQVTWDYGRGLLTADTPCSQGMTGFLSHGGAVRLGDVTIESANDYGAIQAISLDGQPLARARKILVQAFTQEQPSGFTVDATGKILKLGKPPLVIKNIAAMVSFRGSPVVKATALDAHGYARGQAAVTLGGSSVILPADALYTVVER
jgi:hypothetical protein